MSRKLRILIPLLVVFGLGLTATMSSGCVIRARGGVVVDGPAAPQLVQVQPGVYVVENYGDSVFYVNGAYWRYDGRAWFRSGYYDAGFVRVGYGAVPVRVRGIRRPRAYVRYRGRAGARYHRVRARRRARANRRNNRRARRANRRTNRRVRRTNRRNNRRVRKQNRRNNRRVRKQDKRDKRDKRRDRVRDRRR